MENKQFTMQCGVEAELWKEGKTENIQVDLTDFYNGYGDMFGLEKTIEILTELKNDGYESRGLLRIEGYYGETEGMTLWASKTIK